VLAPQRELGLSVVERGRRNLLKALGHVTARAVRAEPAAVHVLMTIGTALERHRAIDRNPLTLGITSQRDASVRVALIADYPLMASREGIRSRVMGEARRDGPLPGVVAPGATRSQRAFVRIGMAAGARRFEPGPSGRSTDGERGGRRPPVGGRVTLLAPKVCVRPLQGEARSPVIEPRRTSVRPFDQREVDAGMVRVTRSA
jgi:hypothetical protein